MKPTAPRGTPRKPNLFAVPALPAANIPRQPAKATGPTETNAGASACRSIYPKAPRVRRPRLTAPAVRARNARGRHSNRAATEHTPVNMASSPEKALAASARVSKPYSARFLRLPGELPQPVYQGLSTSAESFRFAVCRQVAPAVSEGAER